MSASESSIRVNLSTFLEEIPLEAELIRMLEQAEPIKLQILSGTKDLTPFPDTVLMSLILVAPGAHKAVMKTLREHYGFQMIDEAIHAAEQIILDECKKQLEAREVSIEHMDNHEVRRTYFDTFSARDFAKITHDAYSCSWNSWFGISSRVVSAQINDPELFIRILEASKAIIKKEYHTLEVRIKNIAQKIALESDAAEPVLSSSTSSNEYYEASLPLSIKECQNLLEKPVQDSVVSTDALGILDKKIRKLLKFQFRDTVARSIAKDNAYEIKPSRFWLDPELKKTAKNKSLPVFRGVSIVFPALFSQIDEDKREEVKEQYINDALASSFYFSKIHGRNYCNFEIFDGIAPKSLNWGFFIGIGYTSNLNVLATAVNLYDAISFSDTLKPNSFAVLQLFAASESVYTGITRENHNGLSAESEHALIQEAPGELLLSVTFRLDSNKYRWVEHVSINPRYISYSAEKIFKARNLLASPYCMQLLELSLQMARGEIDCFSYHSGEVSSWKKSEDKLQVVNTAPIAGHVSYEYPQENIYSVSRQVNVYQPRVEWTKCKVSRAPTDVNNINFNPADRRADYFQLATITDSQITNLSFSGMDWKDATCDSTVFLNCDLRGVNWDGVSMRHVRFINCELDVEALLKSADYVDPATRASLSVIYPAALDYRYASSDEEEDAAYKIQRSYRQHIERAGGFFAKPASNKAELDADVPIAGQVGPEKK
jgi:hypothetical protein